MEAECYPVGSVPGTSRLFRDFCEQHAGYAGPGGLRGWYGGDPFAMEWATRSPELPAEHRGRLADALKAQAEAQGAGAATFANIEKLRSGAAAVVTGQQVGLFGGPLLTLLKAATAIRKAQDARAAGGRDHVPVFWLASEDHDLAEVDQITLPAKGELETLRLGLDGSRKTPVGGTQLVQEEEPSRLAEILDRVSELLGWAPVCDVLRECYTPGATLAGAFAQLLSRVFADFGLIVMDAATREFHALGASVLRDAIEQEKALESALFGRAGELEHAGYHAQVLVVPGHSLLFLLDGETGARLPVRRTADGVWKAGGRVYDTAQLLDILEREPERLSPNALLRPVFQDAILPTAAYVAGPAEIAYFAQSAVLYAHLLGRVTPVLPRLSATLVDPGIGRFMAAQELAAAQVWEAKTIDTLVLWMGARAMPIEGKRKLAVVGNAMDTELTALMEYMGAMSAELGRAAGVSASKMRYQMNRLRRMAAAFEVQKEASLKKQATAIMLDLFPDAHLQERLLGGVLFLARYGDELPRMLVEHAGQECPGHRVLML